jgi:surface protein
MEGWVMSDIRTSLLGGSSSANNFSVNIIDNVTTTTLSSNYPSGKYSLLSSLADSSVDVYAYNSAGNLVGTSSGLTLTTTGEFNKVVILGGTATDLISFLYNQSGFVSTATSSEITAAAAISSVSPSFVNLANTQLSILGSNFASDVAVYFKGTDGTERAADSVTRNSATSLTITSPDTLPTEYSPYSIIVENPGVARPTKSNSHILQDAINAAVTNLGWTRPEDWITLTAPASNEQKFVGLLGISNDNSNYVALLAQGNYTVDWGDGVTENFTSNTKASHQYTYSSISSTITSDGFKQVLVTVTPQAGQNLTVIDLQQTFTRTNLTTSAQTPWLDIAIAGTNLATIKLTGSTSPTFRMGYLQRVNIVSSNLASYASLFAFCLRLKNFTVNSNSTITNTSNMFYACSSLESVPLFNTASVTNMASMFEGCMSLESIPLFNTQSVADMSRMFKECLSLTSVPLFNTASVTSMFSTFANCSSLTYIPFFNTSLVSNMSSMFSGCTSLSSVPLFNTQPVADMSSMFNFCSSLESVPLFTTNSVTSMASMFSNCRSLKSVPLFNTASVTSMSGMFGNCSSLKSVPLFTTNSVTTMASMFTGCNSLKSIPLFNTQSVTTMASMFNGCYSLKSVPLLTTQSVTTMASMFSGCISLKSVPLLNTASVTNMDSMFEDCISLKSVPLFTTQSVTTMVSMFINCYSLESIPSFNMSSMTGSGLSLFVANTINLTSLTIDVTITSLNNFFHSSGNTVTIPNTASALFDASSTRAIKNISINCSGINGTVSSFPSAPFSTSPSTMFSNVTSLILTGLRYSPTPSGANFSFRLDGTALDALYTSLGTAVGAQTLNITSNHGTVDDTPSIATTKGWTVTGS